MRGRPYTIELSAFGKKLFAFIFMRTMEFGLKEGLLYFQTDIARDERKNIYFIPTAYIYQWYQPVKA
jgi:hypothetical protein